jgi:hypothetical protein
MIVNTAYQANALLEDKNHQLIARAITFYVPSAFYLSNHHRRLKLLSAVESHYQFQGRVMSLMVAEQTDIGKQIVSIRRDPNSSIGELQVNRSPTLAPGFRLGGEVIAIAVDTVENSILH